MKRMIPYFLGGFITGLIIYVLFKSEKSHTVWSIENVAEPLIFILATITVLFTILAVVYIILIKQKIKMVTTGEEEDKRDEWVFKKYSELNTISISVFILALTTFTFIASTNKNPSIFILFIEFLMIIALSIPLFSNRLAKVVYKNRDIPNQFDKHYMQKMLATADEGERYIILEGLYKTYNLMNVLLPVSMVLLTIYAGITGDSQLFAILLIAIITITFNACYYLKVRKMY